MDDDEGRDEVDPVEGRVDAELDGFVVLTGPVDGRDADAPLDGRVDPDAPLDGRVDADAPPLAGRVDADAPPPAGRVDADAPPDPLLPLP